MASALAQAGPATRKASAAPAAQPAPAPSATATANFGVPLFLQGGFGTPALQTKLEVNAPGDPFEREADHVAELAKTTPRHASSEANSVGKAAPQIQRKCEACASGGAPCPKCEEENRLVQRKPSNPGSSAPSGGAVQIQPSDAGNALRPEVRDRVEPVLGADLSHVRVHSDTQANEAAGALHAKAFTHQNHIWLGRNQSPTDLDLMAHEATHVVQQGAASHSSGHAEPQPVSSTGETGPQIQRDEEPGYLDRAVSFGSSLAGDALAAGRSAVTTVRDSARDTALAALRLVSPELADMAEQGPQQFVKGLVNKTLHEWIPGLMGGFDPVNAAKGFMEGLGATFHSLSGLLKGEAKSCEGFAKVLDGIRGFGREIMESTAVQTLQEAMSEANAAVSKVVKVIAAPVFDAIASQLGASWKAITGAAHRVWGWIKDAKAAAGQAWDWAAKKLGLVGAEGEEGILDWIKRKAGEVWEEIKATMAPAMGPLKKVVTGLGLFTGLGQIYVLVKYGPKLVDAVTWLWEHRNDPNIIRSAREQMKDSILPQLLEAVSGFKGAVDNAATWLVTTLGTLAKDLLGAVQGVTGVPLLSLAQDALQAAADAVKDLLLWAQKEVTKAGEWFGSIASRVSAFLAPYQEILTSIGLALVNPAMIPLILAGWAWEALPKCIKGPVIDFILDILISAVQASPSLPMFGPLWSLLKPGVLAFLESVRGQPMDTKVSISNKIAKIIRGSSLGFLTGFAKGVLVGVWEGIRDPIQGIWMAMKGLTWVMDYLDSLTTAATAGTRTAAPAGSGSASPSAASAQPSPSPQQNQARSVSGEIRSTSPRLSSTAPSAAAQGGTITSRAATASTPASTPATATDAASAPAAGSSGLSPEMMQDLAAEAGGFAGTIQPDVNEVVSNFWSAAEEYFSGGSGVSFDELATKLGDAWSALQAKMSELGGEMAQKVVAFFSSDAEADSKLGEGVGWLVGNIGFQLLLDYLSAGTWEGIGRVLQMIAKFLNWPMEVLGAAFKLLKRLGGMLLDGLKSLGKMALEAGSGALKSVSKALGSLGEKLMSFAERLLGKFGGAAAREGENLAGREATNLAEKELAQNAEREGLQAAENRAVSSAESVPGSSPGAAADGAKVAEHPSPVTREQSVAQSGHVDSPDLKPQQIENELTHIGEHPGMLEGVPPNRTARIGEHTWKEGPNGFWCRHSSEVCTKLHPDLEKLLKELPPPKATGPIKEGEVVPYTDATTHGRGVPKDRLTGDHIPSRAALVEFAQKKRYEAMSKQLGHELTAAEKAQYRLTDAEMAKIRDEGITVVIGEDFHRAASPTFAGRNSAAQIAQDAADLAAAVRRDVQAALAAREASGQLTREWVRAYLDLYQQNVNRGLIKYSESTHQMFLDFLARAK